MNEIFGKFEALFQIDLVYFTEFYSYVKEVRLAESHYFVKEGQYCQHLGFVKKGAFEKFL